MNRCKTIYLLFLLFACSGLTAQSLQGISENRVIKQYLMEHPAGLKSAESKLVLALPFFEDFSNVSVYPDPAKWSDREVFINATFAIDPVSVGVATLDAIDENGDVYALTDWPASSDRLTSQDFDLSAYTAPDDTVRLSFFYQCGGKGEVPELVDSLLLEFFSPATNKWTLAWYESQNISTDFIQVILDIPSAYYQNGFRFRFRNYTSLSADDVSGGKGALSNADCWNIDYIMMDTEPVSAHFSINDVTLMDPPGKLMTKYELVPWLHLNQAQSITRNYINISVRNLLKYGTSLNIGRSYYVKDMQTGETEHYEETFTECEADTFITYPDFFFAPFTRKDNSKEGIFEVGSYLVTPSGQYKQNDSAATILHFKDYYAYDDGTPEYGFGIAGPSMAGALLAYRFRVFKSDTLRAIDMLFNRARGNYNADLGFRLCVWKDDDGKPGELIFMSEEELTPGTGTEMPGFKRFAITSDEALIITDTVVYVGWKQSTEDFLNLGYDVNRDNLDKIFVNVSGNWFNAGGSIIPGSIMMRAVFGSKDVITGNVDIPKDDQDVILFPNPVTEKLNIETNSTVITDISLYDVAGRLVIHRTDSQRYLDVSRLSPGIYQVLLTTDKNQRIIRKIVVSH